MTADQRHRLHQIKARLAAASPGPWRAHDGAQLGDPAGIYLSVDSREDGRPVTVCALYDPEVGISYTGNAESDAAFIASAPADIAWLLELVDAAAAALERLGVAPGRGEP